MNIQNSKYQTLETILKICYSIHPKKKQKKKIVTELLQFLLKVRFKSRIRPNYSRKITTLNQPQKEISKPKGPNEEIQA